MYAISKRTHSKIIEIKPINIIKVILEGKMPPVYNQISLVEGDLVVTDYLQKVIPVVIDHLVIFMTLFQVIVIPRQRTAEAPVMSYSPARQRNGLSERKYTLLIV